MSNETTVYVNTIYWEGGETYRPIITVKAPKKWPVNRMAFYKSTGSSNNDGKNEYRLGTWFPTLGFLQQKSTLYDDLNKGEDGYILKRNVFSKIFKMQIANWDRALLTEMAFNVKANFYKKIPEFLKTRISLLEDEVKKVGDVCGVLASYCQYWWQVQISAQLGEGLWEKVPEFRDFVLTHDYDDYTPKFNYIFIERSTKLTPINIEYHVDIHTKDDAIIAMEVLNKEHAIITDLLYGDYTLHKAKIMDNFKNGVSISKQRKSKSPQIKKRSVSNSEKKATNNTAKKRKRTSGNTSVKSTRKRV